MIETISQTESKWFKGSRDRGTRGRVHCSDPLGETPLTHVQSETHVPELLLLKKLQALWDTDAYSDEFAT